MVNDKWVAAAALEPARLRDPGTGHDPEFAEQPPHLIDERRALGHGQGPRAVHSEHRLRFLALDRHETHLRPPDRLADCNRIVRVVLATHAVRNDELGGHEPGIVTELDQFPRPVVRSRACFDADHARRQVGEIRQHYRARELLREHRLARASTPCN